MSEIVEKLSRRVISVDLLRGLVMIIMLLDHTREYVHADAFRFSPTDLSKTNALLFFTRWITHLCAPTFVLLSGVSVYLQFLRGKSRAELSKFLLLRGLWLIFLEFTIVRFAILFNVDYSFFGLAEVIWIFGVSMIVLSALIFLPVAVIAVFGVVMIAFHNLLDNIKVPPAVSMAATPAPDAMQKLWLFLHQPGFVTLFGDVKLFVAYPLIPWIGVMATGYALGAVYAWDEERRRGFLLKCGIVLTAFFIVGSAVITYSQTKQTSGLFVLLDFLNVTKYPPSLLFLLMTLGPCLLILAFTDNARANNFVNRILITIGRVPLFYFIMQMIVAHLSGVILNYFAGKDISYFFLNFPASATAAPPDAGFPLWVVYAAWIFGLLILYPMCRWYGKIKEQHRGFPLSYL